MVHHSGILCPLVARSFIFLNFSAVTFHNLPLFKPSCDSAEHVKCCLFNTSNQGYRFSGQEHKKISDLQITTIRF